MYQTKEIAGQIGFCFTISFCLLAFVSLTPNGGHESGATFFQVARDSTWARPLDWPAAWCSIKIIALCVSCFLALDATGTLLILQQRRVLARLCFYSNFLPCVLFLAGSYYLIQALL